MSPLARVRRYIGSEDPRVATANLIAVVLAANTPFYPIYLLAIAGPSMHPGAWLTLCSFPFFLAVPALTRRAPLGGRAMLAVVGTVNTFYCTWLLGEGAGTLLFLLACVVLAPLLFRQAERAALLVFIAFPIVGALALDGRYPASSFACADPACTAILRLNAVSVALLLGFFALVTAGLLARSETVNRPDAG